MDDIYPAELNNIKVCLKLFEKEKITGSLCISMHYMMIMDVNKSKNDFLILHKSIDSIKMINEFSLELKTKDFKVYQLETISQNPSEASQLYSSLMRTSNEEIISELIPFTYKPTFKIIEDGWTAFLLKEEFTEVLMSGLWSLIVTNECPSYDRSVIVPINTTDEDIKLSSRLHFNNRFPVLAFYYKQSQSSLLRCSQYLPNIERLPSSDPIVKLLNMSYAFVDIRSKTLVKNIPLEARIQKNGVFYLDKVETLQINFQKFIEACQDTSTNIDQYFRKLESSQWLDRVRQMLQISRFIAYSMMSKTGNYIVIGDTGFDFELVMTSLVQVILHSDARTIRGFEALVDREWVQGGHPFYERCKHQILQNKGNSGDTYNETESPVFLLFLDCVWQMIQFSPTSFEFNETFLQFLAHHSYFSDFGTFIGNNAQHREEYKIKTETTSLWSYINQNEVLYQFINCLYDPAGKDTGNYVCWPPVLPQHIEIWQELYFGQQIRNIEIRRKIQDDTIQEYKSARNLNFRLRKLVDILEKELNISNTV